MAITQAMCNSFKEELFEGVHDLLNDDIRLALYTSAATLGASTTAYTTVNEVSDIGTGYTAGGNLLAGVSVTLDGSTAIVDFADSTWSAVTFTARGALLYNASKANRAMAVLDFGTDKTATGGDFTVNMPAAAAATALLRIA